MRPRGHDSDSRTALRGYRSRCGNSVFATGFWQCDAACSTLVHMRLAIRSLLTCLLMATAYAAQAAPALYRFDRVHSQILFSVSHDGYASALGMLHIAAGWLRFDPDDWKDSAADLSIDLHGVDMGDAAWNKVVRGESLLDAAQHRYARFTSTAVRRTGPDTGLLEGTLTLRGVTQPVRIAFRLNRLGRSLYTLGREAAGFSASAVLDRTAFGITRNPDAIGEHVTLRLEIEALRDDQAGTHYRAWRKEHAAAQ